MKEETDATALLFSESHHVTTCSHLDAWLDGSLGETDGRVFEAHLATCEACGPRVALHRELEAASLRFRALLPATPPLAPSAIVARARSRRTRQRLAFAAAATALATAAVVVVLGWRPTPPGLEGTSARAEATPLTVTHENDVFTLDPSSEVFFVTDSHVRLVKGRVRVSSDRTAALVESGPVSVSVSHSRFLVERLSASTIVTVEEGEVRVVGPSVDERLSAPARLEVPDHIVATPQTPPEPPRPAPAPPEPKEPPARRAAPATKEQLAGWTRRLVAGEVTQVQRELTTHLAVTPRDAPALMLLADSHRKAGSWALAASGYERVASLDTTSESPRALLLAASLYQDQLSAPAQASRLLERYLSVATRKDPVLPTALLRLARAHEAQGRPTEAVRAYQRLVADHSESPEATTARRRLSALERPEPAP